jgi:hypothetical protein
VHNITKFDICLKRQFGILTVKIQYFCSAKRPDVGEKMNFIEALSESVDEALSYLGEEAKQVVYCHLEQKYGLTRLEIPYRIEEFSEALELLFGTAAKILQTLMMKALFKRIRKPIQLLGNPNNLDFNSYIQSTRVTNLCS